MQDTLEGEGGGCEAWEPDECSDEEGQSAEGIDGGQYATLHSEGAQTSAGSGGHPDGCMPCTFYCFTRRGCNRGVECRFCHLTHQSKLQIRREAWKKQQREKRKSIRERVAAEAAARRQTNTGKPVMALDAGRLVINDGVEQFSDVAHMMVGRSAAGNAGMAAKPYKPYIPPNRVDRKNEGAVLCSPDPVGTITFTYSPSRATLTIGQQTEFWPQLKVMPAQFRSVTPLVPGLVLDPASGVISGTPIAPVGKASVLVEADLVDGYAVRAAIDLEVVDFTRGGFVVGHVNELEPGKFMLLLYVPEDSSEKGADRTDAGRQTPRLESARKDNTPGGRLVRKAMPSTTKVSSMEQMTRQPMGGWAGVQTPFSAGLAINQNSWN